MRTRATIPMPALSRNTCNRVTHCQALAVITHIAVLALSPVAVATDLLRTTYTEADLQSISEANVEYSGCLQEQAINRLESSEDVRRIAGQAVTNCKSVLSGLDTRLSESGLDPDFYRGMIEQMKSRSIRRLLQMIMAAKAAP